MSKTIDERRARLEAVLKAAGPSGLTGAEICERLGIAIDSAEADDLARISGRTPEIVVIGRRNGAQVYAWSGVAEGSTAA